MSSLRLSHGKVRFLAKSSSVREGFADEVRPVSGGQFLLCPSEVNGQIVRRVRAG